MENQEENKIRELLNEMPKNLRTIEEGITGDAINEYYELVKKLKDEGGIEVFFEELKAKTGRPTEHDIKRMLVALSHIGDVQSFREIEKIYQTTENDLKNFALVALEQCRLILENEILDEPIGFIATGLGGRDNKFRCYFVVASLQKPLTKPIEQLITAAYEDICKEMDSELEEVENHGHYLLIKALISFNYAIGPLIDAGIEQFDFLQKEYMCTNVEKPTPEFIEEWLAS